MKLSVSENGLIFARANLFAAELDAFSQGFRQCRQQRGTVEWITEGPTRRVLDVGVLRFPVITQRDPLSNTPIFAASARYIDATGAQQHDAAGRSIITTITHAASADQVAALTASVIVRECLYLVLGEALTPDPDHPETNMLMFSADNIAQCSIRNAIASASVAAPDASDVL